MVGASKGSVRDYSALLRQAVAEARAAGLRVQADQLEAACAQAFTTSSEMLQEHGIAIRNFLRDTRSSLPAATRRRLRACLNETQLAGTGWRKLLALWRRPDVLSRRADCTAEQRLGDAARGGGPF